MGFTIQDMMTLCGQRYSMELIAGKAGWANSIGWVQMVEDTIVLQNFSGRELAVTLGVGYPTEGDLLDLTQQLVKAHAAGLLINIGGYIAEIPQSVCEYCEKNDLPLIIVPWKVYIVDMIHDLSRRIFLQEEADEKIVQALIGAIEHSQDLEECRQQLLPYYDVDGNFQLVLLTTDGLGEMDTVDRQKIGNRLSVYLENITHNGSFFFYDSDFVLMLNDVPEKDRIHIIEGMQKRASLRMPDKPIYVGVGSQEKDLSSLQNCYQRAKAALRMAQKEKKPQVNFDDMGIYRLLYSQTDKLLLKEMGEDILAPVLEYDKRHDGAYLQTLESYLRNNSSIQAVSAELYTHRNTVLYRVGNIKKLLDCDLTDPMDRMKYLLAIAILSM